jgi:hypothetical protein
VVHLGAWNAMNNIGVNHLTRIVPPGYWLTCAAVGRPPQSWSHNRYKCQSIHRWQNNPKNTTKNTLDIDLTAPKLTFNIQCSVSDSTSIPKNHIKFNNIPKILKEMIAQKRKARAKWQITRQPLDKLTLNSILNKLKK